MGWMVTSAIGVILLSVAGFLALRQHRWLCDARTTQGTVVELIQSRAKNGYVFRPRVRFRSDDGAEHACVGDFTSNPPAYKVGESVLIAYHPQTGEGRIFKFAERFGIATILGVIGLAMLGLRAAFYFGNQYVPSSYLH